MTNYSTRDLEIIEKAKSGTKYSELAKEYNMSYSRIAYIIEKHKKFKAYCNEMESLESKNEINQETKLYDLSKLLKFDTRCINALNEKNIRSIDELLVLTEEDIYTIRSIGKTSRNHIKQCMNEYKERNGKQLSMFKRDNNKKETTENVDERKSKIEKSINIPPVNIKVDREYIYNLVKAVDNRQIDLRYLHTEIVREFDRIENINKELLQTLINLQHSRNMPWEDGQGRYKIEMERKLEEILNMYK
ncbi:DNA-directed RNA polymerase subunit alpha C-terminal domain-containing protein [Clostridium aciditolerans]|uniref:RNA polymerase alpha subunit C-terminal domain-containing protein n=1 Tax=Clostridium aciditolerans TaxID=339861 RepID=A0A934HU82_9CLOT|nr:DNA-directed RNA polymerase subunit alpha C-terminal domain-containing protein [Clostridium aciditolerans]MBI6874641.1 hypothetical protein [Clostridium aciditolerans]